MLSDMPHLAEAHPLCIISTLLHEVSADSSDVAQRSQYTEIDNLWLAKQRACSRHCLYAQRHAVHAHQASKDRVQPTGGAPVN
jgi:hypothetical protein